MASRLQVVEEPDEDVRQPAVEQAGISMLVLGLRALSQRALTAIADLFALASVASAFWLWWSTPAPSINQIVSLSIYAMFILAMIWLVRRNRHG